MLHKDEIFSGTTSSGVYSQNTQALVSCLCKLILITATTATRTFDFKVIDSGNRIIFHREGITGVYLSSSDEKFGEFPMRDINTMRIENADDDEAFSGKLSLLEVS